jgi:hypothetical protein
MSNLPGWVEGLKVEGWRVEGLKVICVRDNGGVIYRRI